MPIDDVKNVNQEQGTKVSQKFVAMAKKREFSIIWPRRYSPFQDLRVLTGLVSWNLWMWTLSTKERWSVGCQSRL